MNLMDDECIKFWRGRLGSSWRSAYRTFERFYSEVLSKDDVLRNLSPTELVEWQLNVRGRNMYHIKSLAQQWINAQTLTVKSKGTFLSHISSFFLHNHAPLPPDPSFHFTSDVAPVDGKLDLEAFKRILLNCNKMYRAVFLMMFQAGMGEGELLRVNMHAWRSVLEALTKNIGVFKLVLPGRKKNRNRKSFYTLLSTKGDWAEAFKSYMQSSAYPLRECLFRNSQGKPLMRHNIRRYFTHRAVEAGVIKRFSPPCSKCKGETVRFRKGRIGYKCRECGNVDWASKYGRYKFTNVRYGVNPHEIRDLFRSRWHVSKADGDTAEFMMGHDIDPNKYKKFMDLEPWFTVQEYRKALKWLNVLSDEPDKISRLDVDAKLEAREAEVEALRREVADFRRLLQFLRDPEKMRRFEELLEE